MDPNNPQNNPNYPPNPGQSNIYNPPDNAPTGVNNSPQSGSYQMYTSEDGRGNKTKKILIVLGVLLAIFVFVVVFVLLTSGDDKKSSNNQVAEEQSTQNLYKEPTAIELENLNNTLTDDVTSLSNDTDFSSEMLSDESLDL